QTGSFDTDGMVTVDSLDFGMVGFPRREDIGNERPAKEYVGHLQTSADTQHRQLILLCVFQYLPLKLIPLFIHVILLAIVHIFRLVIKTGMYILPTRQHNSVTFLDLIKIMG